MNDLVNYIFIVCIDFLYWGEAQTGITYEWLNVVLFIFVQPALILLFFILWVKARFVR